MGHLKWFFVFAFVCSPLTVLGWGEKGHETVGAMADQLITSGPVRDHINAILMPGETLSTISVWADCVKHPNLSYCSGDTSTHQQEWQDFENQVGKKNATDYHFADVDISDGGYVYNPTQSVEDVVHGIRESIAALRGNMDPTANPYKLSPRQGLWLLVHLVGDTHQPLHVGVIAINGDPKATLGSNYLYPNNSSCLHSDWDDLFVTQAMKKAGAGTPAQYAQQLISKYTAPALPGINAIVEWPALWATEAVGVARDKALKGIAPGTPMNGTCGYGSRHAGWAITLPNGYPGLAGDTAEKQIANAGYRLVDILNRVWTGP